MMEFESDLVTPTIAPYGTPDLLDIWFDETLAEEHEAWGDYLEATYDPD